MGLVEILPQANLRRLSFNDSLLHEMVGVLKALASAIEFEGQFAKLEEVYVHMNRPSSMDHRGHEEMVKAVQYRFAHLGVSQRHWQLHTGRTDRTSYFPSMIYTQYSV